MFEFLSEEPSHHQVFSCLCCSQTDRLCHQKLIKPKTQFSGLAALHILHPAAPSVQPLRPSRQTVAGAVTHITDTAPQRVGSTCYDGLQGFLHFSRLKLSGSSLRATLINTCCVWGLIWGFRANNFMLKK